MRKIRLEDGIKMYTTEDYLTHQKSWGALLQMGRTELPSHNIVRVAGYSMGGAGKHEKWEKKLLISTPNSTLEHPPHPHGCQASVQLRGPSAPWYFQPKRVPGAAYLYARRRRKRKRKVCSPNGGQSQKLRSGRGLVVRQGQPWNKGGGDNFRLHRNVRAVDQSARCHPTSNAEKNEGCCYQKPEVEG